MQPTDFTYFRLTVMRPLPPLEYNRENQSAAIVHQVLQNSHRVTSSDLKESISYLTLSLMTHREKSPFNQRVERLFEPIKSCYLLPTQNEKKHLPEPPVVKYQIEPDLYTKEFGEYLLQSAGHESTSLLEECQKFLSKDEYAVFLNIQTASVTDSTLSVLITKQDSGYEIGYFRNTQICKGYCQAKKMRSGQIRHMMQVLSTCLFLGIYKYETLDTMQKPLVLSFQNPDRTSTCFLTFGEQDSVTTEYTLDEKSLFNKIESLTKAQGTYLHLTNVDLETLMSSEGLANLERSLMETPVSLSQAKHLF